MQFMIYKTTNMINGKFYIGKHACKCKNCSYMGSGRALRAAINQYGKENFKKEVLQLLETEEEMNKREREIITQELVDCKETYNLGLGGEGGPHFKGKKMPREVVERNAAKRRGKPGYTKGLEPPNKGVPMPENQKQKISAAHKGKMLTEEHREKISLAGRGKSHSDDTKRKMSLAKIGKKRPPKTPEQKERHKEAMKKSWASRLIG